MKKRAPLKRLLPLLLAGFLLACSQGEAPSPYDESYIEFRLASDSPLGFDDIQSIKIYADPYAAFNMKSIYEAGRSVLGDYDYTAASVLYIGFEYGSEFVSRLEKLRVAVTLKGNQTFIDSEIYTLRFQGLLPEEAAAKPYVSMTVSPESDAEPARLILNPVQGAAGAPELILETP